MADGKPHGTRICHAGGCRLAECRKAYSEYVKQRREARKAGDFNGIIPAAKARAHLKELSKKGMSMRDISDVSHIAKSILTGISTGKQRNVRGRTERAILVVTEDAIRGNRLVPAENTWKLIEGMLSSGFSKTELARRLGSKAKHPALQINKAIVTVRSAAAVEDLYRSAMVNGEMGEAELFERLIEAADAEEGLEDLEPLFAKIDDWVDLPETNGEEPPESIRVILRGVNNDPKNGRPADGRDGRERE